MTHPRKREQCTDLRRSRLRDGCRGMASSKHSAEGLEGVSWSVLPLVAGLFVIVEALPTDGTAGTAQSTPWVAKGTAALVARVSLEWNEQFARRSDERFRDLARTGNQRCGARDPDGSRSGSQSLGDGFARDDSLAHCSSA